MSFGNAYACQNFLWLVIMCFEYTFMACLAMKHALYLTLLLHFTGETLLHALTKERREAAAIFLAQRKVDLNIANNKVCRLKYCSFILCSQPVII